MNQFHIIVSGNVQGVCFRATTQERALRFSIKGYVKNLPDGSVEIIAQADQVVVENFLDSLRKDAGAATIDHISMKKNTSSMAFDTFSIKY